MNCVSDKSFETVYSLTFVGCRMMYSKWVSIKSKGQYYGVRNGGFPVWVLQKLDAEHAWLSVTAQTWRSSAVRSHLNRKSSVTDGLQSPNVLLSWCVCLGGPKALQTDSLALYLTTLWIRLVFVD